MIKSLTVDLVRLILLDKHRWRSMLLSMSCLNGRLFDGTYGIIGALSRRTL